MPTATDLVTDLPADFEVFGQAVDTDFVDLLGGTTGQILSKTSATDLDFTWIANDQGDITGVTAGNGITVTSPTGPVPTVAIDTSITVDKTTAQTLTNKTLTTPIIASISNTGTLTLPTSTDTLVGRATTDTLTNKTLTSPALTTPTISTATTNGDILYGTGSGALQRLGIGSSAQVLTVAAGVPSWATPASGGGMTLLSTTTLSGTSTTISSISGSYKRLVIFFRDVSQNTTGGYLQVRPNNTVNTSYNTFKNGNATAWTNPSPYYGDIYVCGDNTPNSGYLLVATLTIDNYANTTASKPFYGYGTSFAGATQGSSFTTGTVDITAAVSSLVIKYSNGGTISGTVLVYGVS